MRRASSVIFLMIVVATFPVGVVSASENKSNLQAEIVEVENYLLVDKQLFGIQYYYLNWNKPIATIRLFVNGSGNVMLNGRQVIGNTFIVINGDVFHSPQIGYVIVPITRGINIVSFVYVIYGDVGIALAQDTIVVVVGMQDTFNHLRRKTIAQDISVMNSPPNFEPHETFHSTRLGEPRVGEGFVVLEGKLYGTGNIEGKVFHAPIFWQGINGLQIPSETIEVDVSNQSKVSFVSFFPISLDEDRVSMAADSLTFQGRDIISAEQKLESVFYTTMESIGKEKFLLQPFLIGLAFLAGIVILPLLMRRK